MIKGITDTTKYRSVYNRTTEKAEGILTNEKDVYNSRYVSVEAVTEAYSQIDQVLHNTINHFNENKVKGFFITISLKDHIALFSTLRDLGFTFHNASGDLATLVKFLPTNRKNRLPGFCTHYVGVGGLVIDFNTDKVLVIKEKGGHDTKGWKVPGGLVDTGEFLPDAAIREVFEETGVKTEFLGVLALREKRPYHFGMNDMYFICLLRPLSSDITQCEFEVSRCAWMSIEDFVSSESTKIETQERVSKLAEKLVKLNRAGEDINEMCWPFSSVKTILPTVKAEHPMYHSKL